MYSGSLSFAPSDKGTFRVTGGIPLVGRIRPQGNKNEALPLLAACCLTTEPVTLTNVPAIEDVAQMIEILRRLGVQVDQDPAAPSTVRVQARTDPRTDLPVDLCGRLRGSVTLAGPLLARTGRVFLPRPGGDRIGRRRLDTHILALQALGARVKTFPDGFELSCDRLRGADILLDEASVTGTENAVCAAVLADGETIIRNAASEPHVQGLCRMLGAMGARIEGVGSNILRVQGVNGLRGASHRIGPDYLEVGSFISLAAVTGGDLLIEDADLPNLRMIRMVFSRLGIETRPEGDALRVPADQSMEIVPDLGGGIPHIDDAPWPGFPADMTSVALTTATQCRGTVLIHEKMFESRLFFVDRLISMGARIVLCDPHRAVVLGPSRLQGSVVSSPDIRAGMAMLIAALCAEGQSDIHNIIQIDRGFSRIDERLRALGAQILRLS
ncbi:MAG: UDP-N-acetylglucosamine 1-carboxyvinyltransferase [Myxococcales bacterium]|nr:UDP-N-acetylglucosamine 1-carboxyvinyltransferase [Myxococcota bacterium]MDW8282051.1 UDP-N-acetylglucosamine 1-carboxyvinyltransferase [Myxococcales bacterium]